MAGIDFEKKTSLYEQAKKSLIKFKDCLGVSKGVSSIKQEQVLSEISKDFCTSSSIKGKLISKVKMNGGICNRSTREVSDKQKLLKLKGVGRKKINTHYENTPIQIYRKCHLQNLKIFR